MKSILSIARRSVSVSFAALALTLVFGAAARAQVTPQVTCVAPDPADAQSYIAYFGYTNTGSNTVYIASGSVLNYFFPSRPADEDAPYYFYPGVHRKAVGVSVPRTSNETWIINGVLATASFQPGLACGGNITYQGRLSAANAAANGQYDLRFQVFDALTGGTAQGEAQTISATVANGVFTVSLDSDALGIPREQIGRQSTFLEIAVKQGTADFTTLAPRQPLTATPFAVSAITAGSATNAANAAQLGGIAANQFIRTTDSRLTDARQPAAGSGNYIQNTTTAQPATNFNIGGSGALGGDLSANRLNADSSNNMIINANSSSTTGTWLTLNNTTAGGRKWSVISTGANNGEGAGKLLFYDQTNSIGRLLLSDAGANITGNLTVSGAINGTVSNATNAANATNVSGGFVQLPLTKGAPPATECNAASQYGRQKVDAANARLYICTAAGWKSIVLQ